MPHISISSYKPPLWLPGGHLQTMYPPLFRPRIDLPFERRRIATVDDDFIDLDIILAAKQPAKGAAVISHGMEGNSHRKYMRGMSLAFSQYGWDAVCRNFRGCSEETNRSPGMYHSGQTDDLHTVIRHCLDRGYSRIFLVGFSMGGNQILKYLGENPSQVPAAVEGATVFSVPCDLKGCADQLAKFENRVYMEYFLKSLRKKVRQKHALFPGLYPLKGLEHITTFKQFDDRYTAPVHGFACANDYWRQSSSLQFLSNIAVPTLLVNARNDPFLSQKSFPVDIAEKSLFLSLETPKDGGHVGFVPRRNTVYWSEKRAVQFLKSLQEPDTANAEWG